MSSHQDPTASINPVDALIAGYIQAIEAGQVPNRRELLDRNPELADALLAFFADFDRMDRVAAPLRMSGPSDETVDGKNPGESESITLRYFGDYELLEEIARGGMGIVYKARQTSLNRLVALKMVLAGAFASPKDVQRFRIEAEAAANLDHPHIVPIFEIGEHDGQQYYAMKFVEGTSLASLPRGTPREEVARMVEVARAIDHAHRRGVLHRDLKPSNILVDADGSRLVTDFGLAKRLADIDGSLTETGQLLGTPRYMSPEQASGRKDLTVAADVYSLGVILYERLSGRTPFLADNVVSLLHQVRESEPPRLSTITPGLGQDLETIARKCLEKDPGRRYASAEALAIDLENWLEGRPILARPVGPISRAWRWCRRNPAVASLIATVAASMIVGTVVSIAFALRAEAKAIEAGISATRSQLVIAEGATVGPSVDGTGPKVKATLGLLTYARAFRQLPDDPKANDLRWFICANLALLGQRFHNLLPPLEGAPITLTAETYSPDRKFYAGASPDGLIRVWEIATGRLRASFRGGRAAIQSLHFSPDGLMLATVERFCYASGDSRQDWLIYDGKQSGGGFHRLSRFECDEKNGVRLWDLTTGLAGPLIELTSYLSGLEFSRDHRLFVTFAPDSRNIDSFPASSSGHLTVWRSSDGKRLWEIDELIENYRSSLTHDGRILLFASAGKAAALDAERSKLGLMGSQVAIKHGETVAFDTERGVVRYRIDSDGQLPWSPDILSHSGREFASKLGDQLRFFDVESGRPVREPIKLDPGSSFPGYGDVLPVEFYSRDDRYFVSRYGVLDLTKGRRIAACDTSSNWNLSDDSSLAFSDDGRGAVDLKTSQALPRPIDGRFHPAVAALTDLDRIFYNPYQRYPSRLDDLNTGLTFPAVADFSLYLAEGFLQSDMIVFTPRATTGSNTLNSRDPALWIPRQIFAADPEVVQLWAEVLCRHQLVEENRTAPLSEAEWESRRQRLVEILPKSSSTILTEVAHDRWHWIKRELIESTPEPWDETRKRDQDRLIAIAILDRVIAVDPHWWDYSQRAMSHIKLEHYNEAAADLAQAARLEGDWLWDFAPEVLPTAMMDRLLVSEDPVLILRDEMKLGDQAVDVVTRQLAILRRSTERTRSAAHAALFQRNQSLTTYRIAFEFLQRKPGESEPNIEERLRLGLANFRLDRLEELLATLNEIDPKRLDEFPGPSMAPGWYYPALALIHDRLGHSTLARQRLAKAIEDAPIHHGGISAVPLLIEAMETILDRGFPADPFER